MTIRYQENKTIIFCCAMGEFRGPRFAQMVEGTKFESIGYTGLARWLTEFNRGMKIKQIRWNYGDLFFVFIVDEIDMLKKEWKEALNLVCTICCCAGIPYVIMNTFELTEKINSPDSYLLE